MNITFIFGPSATPPLTCDCAGAVVYLRFKKENWGLSRDYHGTVRGTLQAREQAADGSWSYVINVHESGLITPTPELSGSMFSTVCCQGCVSTAAEAYNQDEFGGRLVAEDTGLAVGRLFVRDTIRPFLISDWRVWVDTPGTVDVKFSLYVDGQLATSTPLVIEAGETVSTALPEFVTGSTFRVTEGSLIELAVVSTGYSGIGSAARGLETWFFGHLNPSPYFSPGAMPPGGGSGPGGGGGSGLASTLVTGSDGAQYEKTTYAGGTVRYKSLYESVPGGIVPGAIPEFGSTLVIGSDGADYEMSAYANGTIRYQPVYASIPGGTVPGADQEFGSTLVTGVDGVDYEMSAYTDGTVRYKITYPTLP